MRSLDRAIFLQHPDFLGEAQGCKAISKLGFTHFCPSSTYARPGPFVTQIEFLKLKQFLRFRLIDSVLFRELQDANLVLGASSW